MKTRKQLTIILFAILIAPAGLLAQEADQKIGSLLSRGDWFALEEEFPKEKNKLQSAAVKGLSEVMLDIHFNRPDEALIKIDSLLRTQQEALGFGNVSSLVALKAQILGTQGKYARSADEINDFLDQIAVFAKKEDFPSHLAIAKLYDALRNEPAPAIIRPGKDTHIPMQIEKAGKGVLMFVPVTIHGKKYSFIFDTGASFTFVSERFAGEIGLRIVRDSITLTGVETGVGKSGTIDSLVIGDIIFKHPIIAIAPPNPAVDTLYRVDAVLGLDFIRMAGETRIFPQEGKIVFPYIQSELPATGRNLMLQDGQPYLKAYSGEERLILHLDTGNASAGLSDIYYRKHKNRIQSEGTREIIKGGGFGGIRETESYKLHRFPLRIGMVEFELSDIYVATGITSEAQRQEDGSLGMDFIKCFQEVIVNFDKMFISVKK